MMKSLVPALIAAPVALTSHAEESVSLGSRRELFVDDHLIGGEALGKITGLARIRVNWSGENQENTRLFAIYVENP